MPWGDAASSACDFTMAAFTSIRPGRKNMMNACATEPRTVSIWRGQRGAVTMHLICYQGAEQCQSLQRFAWFAAQP